MIPQEDSERYSEIERQLTRLYRSVAPDPEFAHRLENRLDEQARQMAARSERSLRRSWSESLRGAASWMWAAGGFALLVAVIVFAVSLLPQRPSALPQVMTTQESTPTTALTLTALPTLPQTAEPPISLSIPGVITYTVQKGDTLLGISEKFGVSVASLVELNNLAPGDILQPGRQLLIAEVYRVIPGDTCASIAFKYGVTVEDLARTNNLSPTCNNLRSNQELVIPVRGAQASPTPSPVYVMAKQDTVILRAAPGTSYAVVGALSPGEKLIMNGEQTKQGWVPVEYPPGSGETAWVWVELVIVLDAGDAQHGVPAPADWVRASNPRLDGDKLLVDVCFNLLDDGDWMIREAFLRINQGDKQAEIFVDAGILISLRPFTTDSEGVHHGERCDALEFPVGADFSVQNATLVVRSLEAFPREGQDCELYMTRVQPLLTARDTGILISCESQPGIGGLFTVTAKPEGMTREQAQELVYQAFQDSITLSGPWEFELESLLSEGGALPNLEAQQPILAALRELNRLRSLNYFQGPGWVHMLSREMYKQSVGTLPNGAPIPAEYQMDLWYELDAEGKILRMLTRQMDLSGKDLQVAITQNGLTRNLTFQETREQEVFYLQPMDYAFSDLAISAAKTNKKMTQQPLYFEGKYVGEQFIIEDDQVRWESVFDPTTGRQISFSTWKVIPEGLQFISSVVIEAFENLPAAPPEVLAYFDAP